MSPVDPIQARSVDPSQVPLIVSEVRHGQYLSVALLTLLVYHSVITLDAEVKYFWDKPRSTISIIYFVVAGYLLLSLLRVTLTLILIKNRYMGLASSTCIIFIRTFTESPTSCGFLSSPNQLPRSNSPIPGRVPFWISSVTELISVILIEYILLIRALALYHQDKKLSICLKFLLFVETGVDFGILIRGNVFQDVTAISIAKDAAICDFTRFAPQALGVVSWAMPLAYELILLVLALYKAAQYWKLSSGFEGLLLIRVLIRDQVLYFGFVIFCCTVQIIQLSIQNIATPVSRILSTVGNPTLLCLLGGQLLINLKEAGERGANGGTNYTPRAASSASDIEFA